MLRLSRAQLDGACSDKRFPDEFHVDLIFEACDAEMALLVVPLMVAFIVPSTVKSPEISAELDTESEPVICASNIFIYVVLYLDKY